MGSCGRWLTFERTRRWNEDAVCSCRNEILAWHPFPWALAAVVGLLLLGMVGGCAPKARQGFLHRVDRLEILKVGVSGAAEVLLALGEPQGEGAGRTSPALPPRTIWFYDYSDQSGRQIKLNILLVFFHQEVYDGHLWFSSELEFRKRSE